MTLNSSRYLAVKEVDLRVSKAIVFTDEERNAISEIVAKKLTEVGVDEKYCSWKLNVHVWDREAP